MKKYAVLTMDVEDWYDIGYIQKRLDLNKNYSMCDGLEVFESILSSNNINGTFFVLESSVYGNEKLINKLICNGNEIALHGFNHICPMEKNKDVFREEIKHAKEFIENNFKVRVKGYRAPSYSIDRERLDIVRSLGFEYDSSKIDSDINSFYEKMQFDDYKCVAHGIYTNNNFTEFEICTEELLSKRVTISGGGFFRIFPWFISKHLIKRYIKDGSYFVFFIHPFELSKKHFPRVKKIGIKNYFRSHLGLGTVERKINKLIKLLKSCNYEFVTFDAFNEIVKSNITSQ